MEFEASLKAKNLKSTPQRIAILREIKKNGHISIEEIYQKIKKDYPCISLATVYKNVATLTESDILREIKPPTQKQKYELSCDKHIHVSCERCGKLHDVYADVSTLADECKQKTGFDLFDISAVFIGVCPECRKKQ